MKRKILILALVSFIFLFTSNFTQAQQHPNDPGEADTMWITSVPMFWTWTDMTTPPHALPFTVRCSIFTDEVVGGLRIPISFYHSENCDIVVDSILFSDWVKDASPSMISDGIRNDSCYNPPGDTTAKSIYPGMVWYSTGDGLPAGRGVLFTIYFNGDWTMVPAWDTSKSIVLDTITRYPPITGARLEFTTPAPGPKIFVPIFHYGVIGDTVVISGTAYQSDGTTPAVDSPVYCRGKDVSGSICDFDGRELKDITDGSGNFSFAVGKGGYWCVFRDITGGLDPSPGGNAYCFDPLVTDTSGLEFILYTTDVKEQEDENIVIPEEFTLFQNYPNPFNPNTAIKFALPKDCWVKVEVFNLLGQKVRTLADKAMKKGIKKVIWNGKNEKGAEVSSGIYFYRVKTDEFTGVKKMILIK